MGKLQRRRFTYSPVCAAALALAVALALAGCSNKAQVFQDSNEGGWFSKPLDVFAKPDWASNATVKVKDLDSTGPVGPADLVGADGRCAPPVMAQAAAAPAPPAPAPPPPNSTVGTMAGELGSEPPPPGSAQPGGFANVDPNAPPVLGGIALGMTECQTVHRAGTPGNVAISAGERGERRVMLTYLSGPWPGIYHFADGRLQEIDRAPTPPAPPKAPPKKKSGKAKKKPNDKTSQRETEDVYVR
jgi:hypothetical protein